MRRLSRREEYRARSEVRTMAHIIFYTRGIKQIVDQFVENLQWKYFPIYDEKGKPVIAENGQPQLVQGALRPFQLWEFVVSDGAMGSAMNTIWPDLVNAGLKNPHDALSKKYKATLWPLHKALGAKRLPDFDPSKGAHVIASDLVNVVARYPIGYRADKKRSDLGENPETIKTHGNEDL